ncbi:S-adenosyl-L-methionine-dependent methyltransferase [Powellomyces hirtus]|nr:S-adenosyl-L-methionine-dependent methyltransferase [Powellomyces hirtus]
MSTSTLRALLTLVLCTWTIPVLYSTAPKFVAPVYGHYLATQHHALTTSTFIVVLGLGAFLRSRRRPASHVGRLVAVVAVVMSAIPGVMRATFGYSGGWEPHVGPLVSMAVVYVAISFVTSVAVLAVPMRGAVVGGVTAVLVGMLGVAEEVDGWTRRVGAVVRGGGGDVGMTTCEVVRVVCAAWTLWAVVDACGVGKGDSNAVMKTTTVAKKAGVKKGGKKNAKSAAAATVAAPAPTVTTHLLKSLYLALLLLTPYTITRHFPGGLQCSLSSPTHPKYTLLAFTESTTGYIYVIEDPALYGGTRLMRCDHSLIGGAYPHNDYDSTFGSFYFLDYVQYLGAPAAGGREGAEKRERRALQIGLGIGASTRTLLHHTSIHLDLVELDPAVVRFATEFFDLPAPHSVHITDGRAFLDAAPANTYDYVLHDVFTGGLVPAPLFSVQAFEAVRRVLRKDGVLAVNFVGTIDSLATRTVVKTLRAVFPHLECYTEAPPETLAETSLYNMVLYASPNRLTFTPPDPHTLPHTSRMYRHFLTKFAAHNATAYLPPDTHHDSTAVMHDTANPLRTLQYASALTHWSVMRSVFEDAFWTGF